MRDAPGGSFDIDVEQREGVVVVRPSGDLDRASAPLLDEVLGELGDAGASAVLDLAALRLIDSAGVRVILQAYAGSLRDGFGLTMLPGPPPVMRVFELAGVLPQLPFAR